jgi:hypothetical protein
MVRSRVIRRRTAKCVIAELKLATNSQARASKRTMKRI